MQRRILAHEPCHHEDDVCKTSRGFVARPIHSWFVVTRQLNKVAISAGIRIYIYFFKKSEKMRLEDDLPKNSYTEFWPIVTCIVFVLHSWLLMRENVVGATTWWKPPQSWCNRFYLGWRNVQCAVSSFFSIEKSQFGLSYILCTSRHGNTYTFIVSYWHIQLIYASILSTKDDSMV